MSFRFVFVLLLFPFAAALDAIVLAFPSRVAALLALAPALVLSFSGPPFVFPTFPVLVDPLVV